MSRDNIIRLCDLYNIQISEYSESLIKKIIIAKQNTIIDELNTKNNYNIKLY